MMRRLVSNLFKPQSVRYAFGGGHHEIDYHAVVTKNQRSGSFCFTQAITSTPTKLPDASLECLPILMASRMSKLPPFAHSSGNWVIITLSRA